MLTAGALRLLEVVDHVAAMTDFHIADLQTLRLFVEDSGPPRTLFSLEALDHSRITKLSITLSQHLKFFNSISKACRKSKEDEGHESTPSSNSGDSPKCNSGDIDFWVRLPSTLPTHLPSLRKLHVWLDHNDGPYWSSVNERSILTPMEALKTANPQLELVCVLPRVHPRVESSQRHYLPGDAEQQGPDPLQDKLEIHRILRQRYRVFRDICSTTSTENGRVQYVEDFPHLHGLTLFSGMSRAEREQFEADGWRRGVNVIRSAQGRGRYSQRPRFTEPW